MPRSWLSAFRHGPEPATTLASQASADQIASVAGQVAQVAIDPSISVEAKTQQINSLAAQFNQLVLVWQQQTLVTPANGALPPTPTPGFLTPVPSVAPARGVSTPVPLVATPAPALATAVGTPVAPDASRPPACPPPRQAYLLSGVPSSTITIDRTKHLADEPKTGHNRWHPDIAPIVEVEAGEEVALETRDALDGYLNAQLHRRPISASLPLARSTR